MDPDQSRQAVVLSGHVGIAGETDGKMRRKRRARDVGIPWQLPGVLDQSNWSIDLGGNLGEVVHDFSERIPRGFVKSKGTPLKDHKKCAQTVHERWLQVIYTKLRYSSDWSLNCGLPQNNPRVCRWQRLDFLLGNRDISWSFHVLPKCSSWPFQKETSKTATKTLPYEE